MSTRQETETGPITSEQDAVDREAFALAIDRLRKPVSAGDYKSIIRAILNVTVEISDLAAKRQKEHGWHFLYVDHAGIIASALWFIESGLTSVEECDPNCRGGEVYQAFAAAHQLLEAAGSLYGATDIELFDFRKDTAQLAISALRSRDKDERE